MMNAMPVLVYPRRSFVFAIFISFLRVSDVGLPG